MSRKGLVLVAAAFLATLLLASICDAQGTFVATARNFRGALYQGVGPTPGHASEMAMVRCSQDSFAPPSCRILAVRGECPPPMCAPMPMRKPIRKAHVAAPYPGAYPIGRPMP